jgi:hypothetical protein
MSAAAYGSADGRVPAGEPQTLAAPAGLISDVVAITGRAIRGILREPELFIFALIIPVFFFVVPSSCRSRSCSPRPAPRAATPWCWTSPADTGTSCR